MKKHIRFAVLCCAVLFLPMVAGAQTTNPEIKTFENGTVLISYIGTYHGQNFEMADKSYSPYLLGVYYNDNPAGAVNPRAYKIPVKTSGISYVKVNNSNGDIKAGDPLTSSDTPGVAMKATQAGMILGIALEDATASGLVKVRLSVQYMR